MGWVNNEVTQWQLQRPISPPPCDESVSRILLLPPLSFFKMCKNVILLKINRDKYGGHFRCGMVLFRSSFHLSLTRKKKWWIVVVCITWKKMLINLWIRAVLIPCFRACLKAPGDKWNQLLVKRRRASASSNFVSIAFVNVGVCHPSLKEGIKMLLPPPLAITTGVSGAWVDSGGLYPAVSAGHVLPLQLRDWFKPITVHASSCPRRKQENATDQKWDNIFIKTLQAFKTIFFSTEVLSSSKYPCHICVTYNDINFLTRLRGIYPTVTLESYAVNSFKYYLLNYPTEAKYFKTCIWTQSWNASDATE